MHDPLRWLLEHRRGSAEELHHSELDLTRRSVVVHSVDRPALVLGSAQDDATIDLDAVRDAGLELTRRRSGGGAVLLVPGEHLWFDVTVPADDPLHDDDVGRSAWWLGDALADAFVGLSDLDVTPVVQRDALSHRELGRLVCFAALGPGEVTVHGAKLVGLSQRRTRLGSRMQCIVHHRWDPALTRTLIRAGRLGPELDLALERVTTTAALGVADADVLVGVLEALTAATGHGVGPPP